MNIERIAGIIPPIVTPFREDGTIDLMMHRSEVRHMIDNARVHGLAVGGSTGEGHTLTTSECCELVGTAVEEAAGRIPVIAGVICDSTRAAVGRAKALASVSPDALQVTPVHYLFKPDDESMLRYFGEITDRSGLPVIIYNVIPWSYIPVRLLIRILKEVDGVIGVKQSASDVKALADLIHFVNESGMDHRVRIISAVDPLLYSSFQLGADAAIAAILSAVPEMCVALWDAVQSGNDAEAQALHRRILPVWNAIDGPNLPANVKATMQIRGRAGGYPRSPMPSSSEDQVQRIKDALAAANYSSAMVASSEHF